MTKLTKVISIIIILNLLLIYIFIKTIYSTTEQNNLVFRPFAGMNCIVLESPDLDGGWLQNSIIIDPEFKERNPDISSFYYAKLVVKKKILLIYKMLIIDTLFCKE